MQVTLPPFATEPTFFDPAAALYRVAFLFVVPDQMSALVSRFHVLFTVILAAFSDILPFPSAPTALTA